MSCESGTESSAACCKDLPQHEFQLNSTMILTNMKKYDKINKSLWSTSRNNLNCIGMLLCRLQAAAGLGWAAGTVNAFHHDGFLRGSLGLKFLKFCVLAIILEGDPSNSFYISAPPTLHPESTHPSCRVHPPCPLNPSDSLNGGSKALGFTHT